LILFIVLGTRMLPALGAWLVTAGSMIAFVVLLGQLINQRPLGILIGERNLMSLSRFQMVLWTIIVLSAYIVIALGRVFNKMSDPVDIEIDKHIWALMGISATALVGSPLISNTKKDKTPAASETTKAAGSLGGDQQRPDSLPPADKNDPAKVREVILPNSQGTLYSNPTIADASFADMFEGDEIGNTAYVDLAKVQMFFSLLSSLSAILALLLEYSRNSRRASQRQAFRLFPKA